MSFTFSVDAAGGGGTTMAAPDSDSDDFSLSEDSPYSDEESDSNEGANLDAEQEAFNSDINKMLHETQKRKEKEIARKLEEDRKKIAEEAQREEERLRQQREEAARRAQEQRALEKLLGPEIVDRKKHMIKSSKASSVQSFPQLKPLTRVEVVSYSEGTEGAWTPATILAADSSNASDRGIHYEVKYDLGGHIAYVHSDQVRPAPPKSTSGVVFARGEKVEILKDGRWHPAVVIKGTNKEGMTHIRYDRTHKTNDVYNDNDHNSSLKIRFRNEWTGEVKAGRRGAQSWGWVRWENASNEELRSRKASRKRKRDDTTNSSQSSRSRSAKRSSSNSITGHTRKKGEAQKVTKKVKKKKKKKKSSAWAKLAKYR